MSGTVDQKSAWTDSLPRARIRGSDKQSMHKEQIADQRSHRYLAGSEILNGHGPHLHSKTMMLVGQTLLRRGKRPDLFLKRTTDDKQLPSTATERRETARRFWRTQKTAWPQEQLSQALSQPTLPEKEVWLDCSSQKRARIVLLKKGSWFDCDLHR